MDSPEYKALMKKITRFRLSGIAQQTRMLKKEIDLEINHFKYIIEKNNISPEICAEMLHEFSTSQRPSGISRPLKELYREMDEQPELEDRIKKKNVMPQILTALEDGKNVMIHGSAGGQKSVLAKTACLEYKKEHPEYQGIYILETECDKRTSEMELCYARRNYMDGRIQLGYIAEGLIFAEEHPQDLVVLILNEVDKMDIVHTLTVFWKLLQRKGGSELIGHDLMLYNSKNFFLFATDNMENSSRNVSIDNPGLRHIFSEVAIWDPEVDRSMIKKW